MQTYIAILRGINVSGHKLIKMDALRKLFDGMGFKKTKTYIQSGNVVFQGKQAKAQDLEKKIASSILKEFGFEVPVLVKEVTELEVVLKNNPFINKRKEDVTKLHVTFLSEEPEKVNIDKIKGGNYAVDEFIVMGKTVYLFCPNGYGNTKLSNTFFENKLKVTATTRNWKTINELVTMAAELV
ncbi:MAG TPA: DUF1697 domain-containing protein [Bacteroidia bacterium]|jgi:uncharacterized protein (DUF1697 family)|nr:DUF1697 domain-containing protein [Bacteroidia bacterium]